jgi:adenylate kinase family enzyme
VPHHIHIFGASGSGTTSLGQSIAEKLPALFLDVDSYYWQESDPPFVEKNLPSERISMIRNDIAGSENWVLAGSICGWGDPLTEYLTCAVFLHLEQSIRMRRLVEREHNRFGGRIKEGGDMYDNHKAFMAWAGSYDKASVAMRSRNLHENWMRQLPCPILRLDSQLPLGELTYEVLEQIHRDRTAAHRK